MKKITLALMAASTVGFTTASQAKVDVCVFDLLGKSGESYQMAQEWALAAKAWGGDINLVLLKMKLLQIMILKLENVMLYL